MEGDGLTRPLLLREEVEFKASVAIVKQNRLSVATSCLVHSGRGYSPPKSTTRGKVSTVRIRSGRCVGLRVQNGRIHVPECLRQDWRRVQSSATFCSHGVEWYHVRDIDICVSRGA